MLPSGVTGVWLPLELVECEEPRYQPALARAFGGYVIACDDATAALLVQHYGLTSVTLDGTISRK